MADEGLQTLHSRPLSPLQYQKIRVATNLYGVDCRVYAPQSMPNGFMNYSGLTYIPDPVYEGRLLIPAIQIRRTYNAPSNFEFMDEQVMMWANINFPRYSKVIVPEYNEILSFIIVEAVRTKDIRQDNSTNIFDYNEEAIYYKYELITSSAFNQEEAELVQDTSEEYEEDLITDEEFESSIEDINKRSKKEPIIKSNKL